MSEHIGHAWYLAVDVILFCVAVILFLFFLAPVKNLATTVPNTAVSGSIKAVLDSDDAMTVYMGQKSYEGKVLYGSAVRMEPCKNYVTRAAVFEELKNLPDTVTEIEINGRHYAYGPAEESTIDFRDNLAWYLEEGLEEDVYAWTGSGELYEKICEMDWQGLVRKIIYKAV